LREEVLQPYLRYYKILLTAGRIETAKKVFSKTPEENFEEDYLEVALAFKKLKIYDRAHTIYSKIYSYNSSKAEFLHDFAGVKISIANENHKSEKRNWGIIRRLREEAIDLLKRAIVLFEGNDRQKAWCWFDLARTLQISKASTKTVDEAYLNAMQLWSENTFKVSYDRWKSSSKSS
jgi:ATP-dependent DNA helicase RecG